MANNNGPEFTVTLGGTVPKFGLVKLVSGLGVVTGGVASEDNALIGVAREAGVSGDEITIMSLNCVAVADVLVGGAISKGARVFTAASGKGSATATSLTSVGIALQASTADGDVIPVAQVSGSNDDIS
jgi:hypothetical protein